MAFQWWFSFHILYYLIFMGLIYFAWKNRARDTSRYFMYFCIAAIFWIGLELPFLMSKDLEIKIFLKYCRNVLGDVTAIFWMFTIISYLNLGRFVTRRLFIALLIIPMFTIAVRLLPNAGELYLYDFHIQDNGDLGFSRGPVLALRNAYILLIILFTSLLPFYRFLRSSSSIRWQTLLISLAPIPVFITIFLFITRTTERDYSVLAFGFLGASLGIGLAQFKFLTVVPMARHNLFQGINVGVITVDSQDNIIDINRLAASMFDQQARVIIGQKASDLLGKQFKSNSLEKLSTKSVLELEQNGQLFEVHIRRLRDIDDQLLGYLITLYDITQRKHSEQQLHALINDLEAYAHTVAHDLKTPINIIISYLEIINEDPNAFEEVFPITVESSYKALNIIDALLLHAKLRNTEEYPQQQISMRHIVDDVLHRLRQSINASQVQIDIQLGDEQVIGYSPWLEEVWFNLLANAMKYGGDSPKLIIGSSLQPDNDHVRFWVQDFGSGIHPDDQKTLFDEFTRVERMKGKGHGLGLSIVKRIIMTMNGNVGVESTVGKGSTFYFTLPLSSAEETQSQVEK